MKNSSLVRLPLAIGVMAGLCLAARPAGAVVNLYPSGTADRTADIEDALDTARATGDYVLLNAGTYYHSGVVTIDSAELRGVGDSSILHSTNPASGAIKLTGAAPKLKSCKVRTNYTGSIIANSPDRLSADLSMLVYVKQATNFLVDNVTAQTGRGGGIMVNDSGGTSTSSKSYIQNCRVSNTLADGIHLTNGSKYIVVQNNNVTNTGDDLIAVVSYKFQNDGTTPKDPVACNNIGINHNNVSANVWGRGITANGGDHLSITNNTVTNAFHTGMIIVSEGSPYYAWPTSNVTVSNNTLSGCNAANASGQNGMLIKGHSGYQVTNVAVSETDVVNANGRGIFVGPNTSGITLSDCMVDGATSNGIEVQNANNVEIEGTTTSTYTSVVKNVGAQGVSTNSGCTGYIKVRNTRFEQINQTSGNPAFDVIHISNGTGLTATITGNYYTNPGSAPLNRYIECLETSFTTVSPPNATTENIDCYPDDFDP